MDYNLQKSNSTYFTDLDIARTHLVIVLCRPALRRLARNRREGLVLDPASGKPAHGSLSICLGAVACSFRREIPVYRGYQCWSSVLAWNRKWLYIVTHFVPKGAQGIVPDAAAGGARAGWEAKVYATAVSKYVFKVGRLSVHPALVLSESGLLPPRPGGWTSGADQLGDEVAPVGVPDEGGDWDWRRKGMELAAQFQALDDMHELFDGGAHGVLGNFGSY